MPTGKNITLSRALVNVDCKTRHTLPDTQAKLSRKTSSNVMTDCKDRPPRRGFWARVMS